MPKVAPFQLSKQTRAEFVSLLLPLSEEQRDKLIAALGGFAAEVEMHVRLKMMEEHRQGWSDSLGTMLRFDPKE
jgi:hypothetical protein